MNGPNYKKYQTLKSERKEAEGWLAHIGKHGRGADILELFASQASIKLTICGQYTEGGKNYWENPTAFGVAILEVIHADFAALSEKAVALMKERERQALAAAAAEIDTVNAELATALGRPSSGPIHLVFDAFPSPEGARFIEAEDGEGKSISVGEWVSRPDGYVALVIPA